MCIQPIHCQKGNLVHHPIVRKNTRCSNYGYDRIGQGIVIMIRNFEMRILSCFDIVNFTLNISIFEKF